MGCSRRPRRRTARTVPLLRQAVDGAVVFVVLHVAPPVDIPEVIGVIVPAPLVVMVLFGCLVEGAAAD
jgi:hypothetical protein